MARHEDPKNCANFRADSGRKSCLTDCLTPDEAANFNCPDKLPYKSKIPCAKKDYGKQRIRIMCMFKEKDLTNREKWKMTKDDYDKLQPKGIAGDNAFHQTEFPGAWPHEHFIEIWDKNDFIAHFDKRNFRKLKKWAVYSFVVPAHDKDKIRFFYEDNLYQDGHGGVEVPVKPMYSDFSDRFPNEAWYPALPDTDSLKDANGHVRKHWQYAMPGHSSLFEEKEEKKAKYAGTFITDGDGMIHYI